MSERATRGRGRASDDGGGGSAAPTPGKRTLTQEMRGGPPVQLKRADDATADTTASPAATGDLCPDPAEQARKEAFTQRTDLQVIDNVPSPGTGKFDARYFPRLGLMPVTVKIHFDFVQADDTPEGKDLLDRIGSGLGIAQFFWTDAEKADFQTQFVARCTAKWSAQHTLRSTRPCWSFIAVPLVSPVPVADKADAHYAITVHKSSGPGIDYKSGLGREQLSDPTAQPTGDLWQSDVQEEGDAASGDVARDERRRLERALRAAHARHIRFRRNDDQLDPDDLARLAAFAAALHKANPSAPLIPIDVAGFASAEGDAAYNQGLSDRRASNVAAALTGAGVRQPVRSTGHGEVGAPEDASKRRVDISVDHTFETSYTGNRYAVGEHELGHMLGNLDEYRNQTTGATGRRQRRYAALVRSAGLEQPAWGDSTSAIMSIGVDVMPRHYVSLWEALGRMTDPDITQAQWSFH